MKRRAKRKGREGPLCLERVWESEGIPVLRARLELPGPGPMKNVRALNRISRFYERQAESFLRRCERFLLPEAKAASKAALLESRPLPIWEAELRFHVTLRTQELWSLYIEVSERCGQGLPHRRRWGDVWDLNSGWLLPMSQFFPEKSNLRKRICKAAEAQIQGELQAGVSSYREDWKRRLKKHFDPRRFYLTEEGLAVFWPMYALAPAAEGIPTLLLPYGEDGPFLPGQKLPQEGQ